jgi:hypothetical protein
MRRFGIEIEHANSLSHSQIASALETSGVGVDHNATGRYSSRGYNGWQVKHDGSIRATISHPHQVELVSPPLPFNAAGRDSVKNALAVIRETGKVNRSCGFHVHVEASDLNSTQLARLQHFFNSWKKVLLSYVSASRRNNHFCKPTVSARDRYVALNLVPFSIRGTVEFRLHQATLNENKVLAFVALCVNIVEHAKGTKPIAQNEIDPSVKGVSRLVKIYNGEEHVVLRNENGTWTWNGQEFGSLTAVAAAIRNQPTNGPRFFGYPADGNAMDLLCREVALTGTDANFLAQNYDRMTGTAGYFNQ